MGGAEPAAGRRVLLRWLGWFAAANVALGCLVGLRYLYLYRFPADPLGIAYALLAFVGQFALLALVAILLPALVVAALWPRRAAVLAVAVPAAALLLAGLVLDSGVYVEYRFHLSMLTMALFAWTTWAGLAVLLAILLVFQSLLAGQLWRWLATRPQPAGGRPLALLLVLCWLGGQGLHIWGDAAGHVPITQFSAYLPAYYPIHAKRRLARLGLVDPAEAQERQLLRGVTAQGDLQYPLSGLDCPAEAGPNLLVILIDGMRPDALHPDLVPTLHAASGESQLFLDHWSGGNSSRMGMFALFYGLPAPYWEAFNAVQRPPVLVEELRRRGYAFGLHSAVGFGSPTLMDRTIFAGHGVLPAQKSAARPERNRAVTRDWLEWLGRQQLGQPFFGLLYYDPPVGDLPQPPGMVLPLDERYRDHDKAHELWTEYRLGLRMVDREIGVVLADLSERGLLEETVIVFASDHGYEFDDTGLGYFRHASAFTPAQLRSLLFIRWPGRVPRAYAHRSSHLDLPATLLPELLGCDNDPADFSLGHSLFAGVDWEWLVAGSYSSWAIVEPGRVTVSRPGGLVEVLGPDYRPASRLSADPQRIAAALAALRRFYR